MRGLVFWKDSRIVLLTEKLETMYISDYEELYADMALTKAEIVDVILNEATGLVNLKSLFGTTLYCKDQPCMAEEAIAEALKTDPDALVRMMNDDS